MQFQNVETFIASGNVIFETNAQLAALEQTIAAHLEQHLGYAVAAFVRNENEMRAPASYQAFPQNELDAAGAFNVAFLAQPLNAEQTQKLMALENKTNFMSTRARCIGCVGPNKANQIFPTRCWKKRFARRRRCADSIRFKN